MADIPLLQRLTTEFIVAEDRLRLTGEIHGGQPVVIWLTHRLIQRLLPVLLDEVGRENPPHLPRSEVLQSFAQEKARAAHEPEPPVPAAQASQVWLASGIDIQHRSNELILIFLAAETPVIALSIAALPLRQWLNILYKLYEQAEWPLDIWPEWMKESNRPLLVPASVNQLH